ncbi:hypothetical protein PO587_38690 [Streptomyces gilvifuscus]|uniref:Uncharacterized protein n=1 Tax=Streptomyces gilvifuscus TaxID=1550617 RepID=A0ABT5G6L6_9ACTN|nr:hypothetical protein [Streptomyces gilvifuscus]MDC2960370.1 hypothetical protein [Streptomyces gilvifuscus]
MDGCNLCLYGGVVPLGVKDLSSRLDVPGPELDGGPFGRDLRAEQGAVELENNCSAMAYGQCPTFLLRVTMLRRSRLSDSVAVIGCPSPSRPNDWAE